MKEKNHDKFREVIFGAGRPFDAYGRATSYWTGVVTYKWNKKTQVFHVHAEQTLGTGTVENSAAWDEESSQDVNSFLDYFKELEAHYKKVYGE